MFMLKILRNLLQQIINDIDSGNSNISEENQQETIQLLQRFYSKDMSKTEAAKYIGVSRATFDNYINKGLIPKGIKRQGWKELSWKQYDLNKFLAHD